MSAGNAFPNFTAKTCKNVSMQMHQHPVQLWVEFVEKQQETPGSHQKRLCGYENQRETILRVRDCVKGAFVHFSCRHTKNKLNV